VDTIELKRFSGVFVVGSEIRRLSFDAKDVDEARGICTKWGVGLEGESATLDPTPKMQAPVAYDTATACRLLGGISRTTLYKWLSLGYVCRVPATRRFLITRESIERRCQSR